MSFVVRRTDSNSSIGLYRASGVEVSTLFCVGQRVIRCLAIAGDRGVGGV